MGKNSGNKIKKSVDVQRTTVRFHVSEITTGALFALRVLMEECREGQKELHCVFVDMERVYGKVSREEVWYCMRTP